MVDWCFNRVWLKVFRLDTCCVLMLCLVVLLVLHNLIDDLEFGHLLLCLIIDLVCVILPLLPVHSPDSLCYAD